jgi:hypothetical protein
VQTPAAQAQTPAAPAISQDQPNAVSNGTAVELVISGSNFGEGAVNALVPVAALK